MADHVAVGDEDVLRAVEVVVDEAGAEADVIKANGGYTGAARGKNELRAAGRGTDVAIQRVNFVLVVGDKNRHPIRAVVSGGIDPHAAVGMTVVVLGRSAQDS